jgi:hypothetical protein
MINPDYHPDTAHLPSARDKDLWQLGGEEKEIKAREKLAQVRNRWERADHSRGEFLRFLESEQRQP